MGLLAMYVKSEPTPITYQVENPGWAQPKNLNT